MSLEYEGWIDLEEQQIIEPDRRPAGVPLRDHTTDPVVENSKIRRNTWLYWELRTARQIVQPHLDDARFGRGGNPNIENFSKWHPYEQSVYLLWLNGCRVPFASAHDNGVEWMNLRARETNYLFTLILDRAKKVGNESLFKQLSEPRKRLPNEPMPVGIFEMDSGPANNDEYIYPMQGIFGYLSPRIMSEIIGRREKGTTHSLFENAVEQLDSVLKVSQTPSEFAARLIGKGFENGAGAIAMLSHAFPNGILTEQNCFQDYQDLARDLKIYAPRVSRAHLDASPQVLEMNDIAPIGRFSPQIEKVI